MVGRRHRLQYHHLELDRCAFRKDRALAGRPGRIRQYRHAPDPRRAVPGTARQRRGRPMSVRTRGRLTVNRHLRRSRAVSTAPGRNCSLGPEPCRCRLRRRAACSKASTFRWKAAGRQLTWRAGVGASNIRQSAQDATDEDPEPMPPGRSSSLSPRPLGAGRRANSTSRALLSPCRTTPSAPAQEVVTPASRTAAANRQRTVSLKTWRTSIRRSTAPYRRPRSGRHVWTH